jgi:hypothetical protein
MIASVARVATKANHKIISNWLKRTTRAFSRLAESDGIPSWADL